MKSIHLDCAPSGLATMTLVQGERGNPIDGAFTAQFKQVVLQLWDWQPLRAVLLRAEGPNFSVGGDLKSLTGAESLPSMVRAWTSDLHAGLSRFWQLPVPVVAQVQGKAAGGALGLIAGCDLVVCSEDSQFAAAFAKIGFSCDSGTSAVLTMRMGASRARRFQLLAETLSAQEAMAAGLVDRVVRDEDLAGESGSLASSLASGPTLANGQIKRLFLRAAAVHLESQLEDEALTLARIVASNDAREGVAAFVGRRKPQFTGT